jgi:hypothetical protein
MEGIYVHMCDLQVVMKANWSSEFGMGSPYRNDSFSKKKPSPWLQLNAGCTLWSTTGPKIQKASLSMAMSAMDVFIPVTASFGHKLTWSVDHVLHHGTYLSSCWTFIIMLLLLTLFIIVTIV